MLLWATQHPYFCYFNPNRHLNPYSTFEHFLCVGSHASVRSNESTFHHLQNELESEKRHLIGYFSYELKNETSNLKSKNPGTIIPFHSEFFTPKTIIKFSDESIDIESEYDPENIWKEINSIASPPQTSSQPIDIQCDTSKEEYVSKCKKIKEDIVNGEYYELNYCIEFKAKNCEINPIQKYLDLNDLSPMPFSCLGKFDDIYVLCASPERFIRKDGQKLVSQPIKGTIRRGKDETEDQQLRTILKTSQKELAENMMIVDLVRNDLSKCSVPGSVKVDEFFGIYSFKQVHQMISTISSTVKDGIKSTEIIDNSFPMGSMTGAPKKRVMEAIDQYENSQRGIYSGSIGYFTPDGDFDFNVVIRSIIYDQKHKNLSFHVGSAITFDADPEYEYEECLLKAKSMMEILSRD